MTAWSHLPNAKHIDQVLADLKSHPEEIAMAWLSPRPADRGEARLADRDEARRAARQAAWNATWGAVRSAAWDAAWDATRDAAWDAAWAAARDAARGAAWAAAWAAARSAITTLIAWDHSSKYLTMTYQELGMWYQLNEDPAALLLLPYLKAQELISQKIRT